MSTSGGKFFYFMVVLVTHGRVPQHQGMRDIRSLSDKLQLPVCFTKMWENLLKSKFHENKKKKKT